MAEVCCWAQAALIQRSVIWNWEMIIMQIGFWCVILKAEPLNCIFRCDLKLSWCGKIFVCLGKIFPNLFSSKLWENSSKIERKTENKEVMCQKYLPVELKRWIPSTGFGYVQERHDCPVALIEPTPRDATQGCAFFSVPGQYLMAVPQCVVRSYCAAVGERFDQGKWFGYQENPGRKIKPQHIHRKANKFSQKPLLAELRRGKQLLQGSQQASLHWGTGCASWGWRLLLWAASRVGVLRVLSLKIKQEFSGMKATAPSFWLVLSGITL